MKPSFLLCIALVLPFWANAQQASIDWEITGGQPRLIEIKKVLQCGKDSFLLLQERKAGIKNTEYYLSQISLNGTKDELTSPLFQNATRGKTIVVKDIIHLRGKSWLMVSSFDKVRKRHSALAYGINAKGHIAPNSLTLVERENAVEQNLGTFNFIVSSDATQLLVEYSLPFERLGKDKFNYTWFDATLTPFHDQALEFPFPDEDFTVSNHQVDPAGNIYMLAQIRDKAQKWKSKKANFRYGIMAFLPKTKELREYAIQLEGRTTSNVIFKLAENGMLIASGFYSNLAKGNNEAGGVFYLQIDLETQEVISSSFQDLSQDFLLEFLDPNQIERGKELNDFIPKMILPAPEGHYMIAEQSFVRTSCDTDLQTGILKCSDQFYFNDLIIVLLGKNGAISSINKVEKKQFSVDDGGPHASFLAGSNAQGLHLFFNDHPGNLSEDNRKIKYLTHLRSSVVRHVHLLPNGQLLSEMVLNNAESSVFFAPKSHNQIRPGHFLIYGQKNREFGFGKLRF